MVILNISLYGIILIISLYFVMILLRIAKAPEHRVLRVIRRLGGAYDKIPAFSQEYYEVGARVTLYALIAAILAIDVVIFLMLFKQDVYLKIVGGP